MLCSNACNESVCISILFPSFPGAKLVFVGRPVMWGLHHSGQSGVEKVFDILQTEMVNTLKLIGAPSPRDLTPDMIIKGGSSTDITMKRLGLN